MADKREIDEKYENFVNTQEYDYGEYFNQLDLIESILEEVDETHLEKGLSEYIAKNYNLKSPDEEGNGEKAGMQAKALVRGNYDKYSYIPKLNDRESYKKLVKAAISEGYVWKFRIDEPWHGSFAFSEERVFTYPFQHKYMVLYTGQAKHVFFSKAGKWDLLRDDYDVNEDQYPKDLDHMITGIAERTGNTEEKVKSKIKQISTKFSSGDAIELAANKLAKEIGWMNEYRNPDSILEQGALLPGNQHVGGDDEQDYDRTQERAVWLGFMDKARMYPAHDEGTRDLEDVRQYAHPKLYDGSVVFEVEVPTNWVAIKKGQGGLNSRIASLEDCINTFGNPINMASHLDRDNEFVIPSSTGRLPLHYIKGVWDKEEFPNAPHFMSLQSFVSLMEQRFPKRMPGGETHIKSDEVSKKDLEKINDQFNKLKEVAEKAQTLSSYSMKIYKKINTFKEKISEINELEKTIPELRRKENVSNRELQEAKNSLEYTIKGMERRSKTLYNLSRSRALRFSDFLEALENISVNVDPSEINKVNYKQHVQIMSTKKNQLPGNKISKQVRDAHKKAGRAWENEDKNKTQKIISELTNQIESNASDFYLIQYQIDALMELLEEPLASLSEENRQRVQENILKGWKEAEESTKESFEF